MVGACKVAIAMRLFIFALSLAVVAAASEKSSPRGGRAFPSPKNKVAMVSSASREYDGVLSSLFRTGHGQNNERSGMNMMANPVGTTHSAVKKTSSFEKASLLKMGHGQNNKRSGMNSAAKSVGKTHSAMKDTSPIEKSLPSFRSSCCTTVEVWEGGYSKIGVQELSYGTYHMQSGAVNGWYWWKNYSTDKCIWWTYENGGQWIVGMCSDRGTAWAHFTNNEDTDCPEDPFYTWEFYDGSGWSNANERMSIYCL